MKTESNRRLIRTLVLGAGALAASSMLALGISRAFADSPPAPPAGWVAVAPPSSSDKPMFSHDPKLAPICCGSDPDCCEIQRIVDSSAGNPDKEDSLVEVRVADLPLAVLKTAPAGGPGVEGVPQLVIQDDNGQPAPFAKKPEAIRFMPPGELGEITHQGRNEPFFKKKENQGQGYGVVTMFVGAVTSVAGPYQYRTLSRGTGGNIQYDFVEGELHDDLSQTVKTWLHVEPVPVLRGTLFGFRETTEKGEVVHLVMPQVIMGFTSLSTNIHGAFFPSRFSRDWSYSDYVFPSAPGKSGAASFRIQASASRMMSELGVTPDKDLEAIVRVDVNRLSGEESAVMRFAVSLLKPSGF